MSRIANVALACALLGSAALVVPGCGGASNRPASKEMTAREIVERYKPAIVRIENDLGNQIGVGTGFIVTPGGRIATNLHVIAGGGNLLVKMADGTQHEVIGVVAVDMSRDLAIIQIDAPTKMPTVPIGNSDNVSAGDSVVAIGNPMRFDFTVSDGLISSVRPIENDIILQISAPISQGSSGGPLFNSSGEVIGVARMVSARGQNLNFGVPINYLRPLLQQTGSQSMEEFAKRFKRPEPATEIKTDQGVIHRDVLVHDLAVLKGCSNEQLLKVFKGISRAIELGAPVYNDGDHQACYGIYEQTAAHYERDNGLCKGLRDTFGGGLLNAETKKDWTSKAWAMRDTFDGVLNLLVRKARSQSK